MRELLKLKIWSLIVVCIGVTNSQIQAQNPHDIYDLRVGVERYYTGCFPLPDVIACGLSYHTYQLDRVIGTKIIEQNEYAEIEYIYISNEKMIVSRDTIYQRIENNELLQWFESEHGSEEVSIYRFNFVPGDSVKSYVRNLALEGEPYQIENKSIISADTTVVFPDGQTYRIAFGSDGTYPWNNSKLFEELSDDWPNSIVNQGTLGSNKIGLNWLVPFANVKHAQYEASFYPGIHTFYHVSRFGPILSMSYTGLRYLAGFKSQDGQVYGYFHEGIPVGIDRNEGEMAMGFRLLGNYPNPFNPMTVIRFQLSEISEVRLEVLNMLGQQVAMLVNHEVRPAGVHEVGFDASGLSSGIYLYRLIVRRAGMGNTSEGGTLGKMLLIK
jgi:hypothetical protein